MSNDYDAIVVGARCAGAPTAMLLARRGYRVLLVDRATFPSDTTSTHVVQPNGVAALARWGLLERLVATGCPPIDTYVFDFGPVVIEGSPGTPESPVSFCPRRLVLDKLLVDAAVEAGVEVREGFTVSRVLIENGRVAGIEGRAGDERVAARGRVVIGADGWRSVVAKAVRPEGYHEKPPLQVAYYSYFSGLPMDGRFEIFVRPNRGFAAVPTHDEQTLIIAGWPIAEMEETKRDIEGHFAQSMALAPAFAERFRSARREARFAGAALPNQFRKPYGPGWVLVGDAGYVKDAITAQGIQDAFRDAESCAAALDDVFSGRRDFDAALGEHQRARDEHALPMFGFTCELATLAPPSPQMQRLFGAIAGKRAAMDGFVRTYAGTLSPARFFAPENIDALMAA
jgi:2-polyprenyl-6-methoxyphenol hydroxylase-like FAD-dependent oxidoreductase